MLVRFETILILLAVTFSTSRGGSMDEEFLKSFSHDEETKDAIVEFPTVIHEVLSHPDLNFLRGSERKSKIVELLQKHTKLSQLTVINQIASLGLADKATSFWVANKISIKNASLKSLKALAASSPEEFKIRQARTVNIFPVDAGIPVEEHRDKRETIEHEWGVKKIGADIAFNHGITGEGKTIALIDTGVRRTHEALINNFRSAYGWLDAIDGKTDPYDDNGHGSHTAGIAVGKYGIGVAPGAKFMSCKALDSAGSGYEEDLTTCGQWLACPNNSTGVCLDQPDVASCSWGGGYDDKFYNTVIESWIGLDIIPVFAIGNGGPACFMAISPGDQPNVISAGATGPDDKITDFSSRGPGGPLMQRPISRIVKPEVVAPGLDIMSVDAQSDTAYIAYSGTSMATPNIAGAIALLLSSGYSHKFQDVRQHLEATAVPYNAAIPCSVFATVRPNNEYGYGRISVPNALGLPG